MPKRPITWSCIAAVLRPLVVLCAALAAGGVARAEAPTGGAAPQAVRAPAVVRPVTPGPVAFVELDGPQFASLVESVAEAVADAAGSGWTLVDLPRLPRAFTHLPADARQALESRLGGGAAGHYHARQAALLAEALDRVRGARTGVLGLPVEADRAVREPRAVNAAYAVALDRVGAMTSARVVIRGGIGGDTRLLRLPELMPEAHRLADGRPILFRLNRAWRMVRPDAGGTVHADPDAPLPPPSGDPEGEDDEPARLAPAVEDDGRDDDAEPVGGIADPPAGDDADGDGVPDDLDGCPNDPLKSDPGACGCGVPDDDGDGDGWPDCIDGCPEDPSKSDPGACGCGVPDIDSDGDGALDCIDGCPDDAEKYEPGDCGCGQADTPGCHDPVPLGVNVDPIEYYMSAWVFTDLVRSAKAWMTLPADTPWGPDTQQLAHADLDQQGWPEEVPFEVPGGEPQIVATLMARSIEGHYPAGTYEVRYEGTGTLGFGLDATNVQVLGPGHLRFDVPNPSGAGIQMKIVESVRGDHVRNVRVLMPGMSDPGPGGVAFHPAWIDLLEPFDVVRFMNWQRINSSQVSSWDDRTRVDRWSQHVSSGVAPEIVVAAANATGKDPWICIPHRADEDYVRHLARLFRDELDPSLEILVEYSNETWNAQFQQHDWIEANGPAGLNAPQKRAWFTKRAFDWWMDEFAGQEQRVRRVVAGQHVSPWTVEQQVEWLAANGGGFEVIATAPYFRPHHDDLDGLDGDSTPEELKDLLVAYIDDRLVGRMSQLRELADAHGATYMTYEAGQHLAPHPAGTTPPYLPLFVEMQRHPAMADVYAYFFARWAEETGGSPMVVYSLVRRWGDGRWGSWGHLEFMDETTSVAPKWHAVLGAGGRSDH